MEAYALNKIGRFDLTNKETIVIYKRGIYEIKLPDNCKSIDCSYNRLTELVIPNGCKKVYCRNNNISELLIPDSCVYVDCRFNKNIKIITNNINCVIYT